MNSRLQRSFELADLFLSASRTPTYITMMQADASGIGTEDVIAKFAGMGTESVIAKFAGGRQEVSALAATSLENSITIFTNGDLSSIHGDIYEHRTAIRNHDFIVSCSSKQGWQVDLMLSLLLDYSIHSKMRFHHVGFSHTTEASFRDSMIEDSAKYAYPIIFKPARDHQRGFIKVETSDSPKKGYWIEHQFFSDPKDRTSRIHWDFAVIDPSDMLLQILKFSSNTGVEMFDLEPNSPQGMVETMGQDGTEFAIMARKDFTDPETW